MANNLGELVDEKTVARVLGVDPRTVRRWRKGGKVPFLTTPTGRIRYRLADLIAVQLAEVVRKCPPMSACVPSGAVPFADIFIRGGTQ